MIIQIFYALNSKEELILWAKIVYKPDDREYIFVPYCFSKKLHSTCDVIFGRKKAEVKMVISLNLDCIENSTYDNPMIIILSSKLKDKLFIPESQIYRMSIKENKVIFGPVIGLMLGTNNHTYDSGHMKKYSDRFGVYDKVGGLIFAFSPTSVDWEKEIVYGIYYNIAISKWIHGVFPLPDVIYARNFHNAPEVVERLSLATDGKLFNSHNYTKLELFSHVKLDEELAKNLPPTEALQSYDQLKKFIDTHTKVILKPINLSRGRGICIIEKSDSLYRVFDYRSKECSEITLNGDDDLLEFFSNNDGFFSNYLIQKYIRLAKIDDRSFDIRVVMQKRNQRRWSCTGIECRVSGPNNHITNISRGGHALLLNESLALAFEADSDMKQKITEQIHDYCFRFCKHMDKLGEHFAEFGMDIALDEDKNIWLIESNVLPSFKGFIKMDYDMYLSIRYSPLLYALSLTEFEETETESGGLI